jgi:hypothetical protein
VADVLCVGDENVVIAAKRLIAEVERLRAELEDALGEVDELSLEVVALREALRRAAVVETGEEPNDSVCEMCDGTKRVPGMVMLDERHGAAWGNVPCPDCGGSPVQETTEDET